MFRPRPKHYPTQTPSSDPQTCGCSSHKAKLYLPIYSSASSPGSSAPSSVMSSTSAPPSVYCVSLRFTYNGTRRVRQLALGCESNWVKSTHDAYENTWKWAKALFFPIRRRMKKNKKKCVGGAAFTQATALDLYVRHTREMRISALAPWTHDDSPTR